MHVRKILKIFFNVYRKKIIFIYAIFIPKIRYFTTQMLFNSLEF